ncbi:MAG: response regulator transcription factor [Chloroflexota bacterium]|nr:response regulator transcription factor [Chloroflexota bacterium]
MRQNPEAIRSAIWRGLQQEVVRAGLCVLLLLALLGAGLHIGLVLGLPFLAYAGLWLMTSSSDAPPQTTRLNRAAQRVCLDSLLHISTITDGIADPESRAIAGRVTDRIAKILDVISEDRKYEAYPSLQELMTRTDTFLTQYGKLVRRGLDSAEVQLRVQENLAALERAYTTFWEQLIANDLKSLGETVDKKLEEMTVPPDAPSLSSELSGDVIKGIPPEVAQLIGSLTPRELEILRLLAAGMKDQEIADALFNSVRTVQKHIGNIYDKIEVRNRAEAVLFASKWGLTS